MKPLRHFLLFYASKPPPVDGFARMHLKSGSAFVDEIADGMSRNQHKFSQDGHINSLLTEFGLP